MKSLIYLAQTDTTAGLLSYDFAALNRIKGREESQPCILTAASWRDLGRPRVPNAHKNRVRRAKKTTFLLPNGLSFRIVQAHPHAAFLRQMGAMYSTSANPTGKPFDPSFAISQADVVVDEELHEGASSNIIKLSRTKAKKLR
jgi:tRNA A37 threonylcarbamoyladenosine synthetase subunit TsaC/SUA5/YrdC